MTPRAGAKAGKKGKDLLRASIIEKNKKTVVPRALPVERSIPRYKKGAVLPYEMGGTGGKQSISEEEAVRRSMKKK